MGLVDSIKGIFSSDNEERNKEWIDLANQGGSHSSLSIPDENDIKIDIVDISPNLYLAHRAGRICVGKMPIQGTMNDRMVHVEKMLNQHHESVTEHTNVIAVLTIPLYVIRNNAEDFGEIMVNTRYCHVSTKSDAEKMYILIGGSARAFYYLCRETKQTNFFLPSIYDLLKSSFEKCLLIPLIDLGYIDKEECTYIPNAKISEVKSNVTQIKNSYEKTDVENYDMDAKDNSADPVETDYGHCILIEQTPVINIFTHINQYGFTIQDAFKVATISFVFHKISRSCSHQLVRHRNAISQESQRYTSHEYVRNEEYFVDPVCYNSRYKDPEFDRVKDKILQEDIFRNYNYLISNKILKEDARAYLPTNVTTQLMMTFTYENYAYFLQLRLDKAAQQEIRDLARESYRTTFTDDNVDFFIEEMTNKKLNKKEIKDPLQYLFPDAKSIDDEEEMKSMEVNSVDDAKKMLDAEEKLKEES